ncbi:hypothetical protein HID58_069875 [Brassica napus]|uniref:Uncharacterized protein n=1 Tax=Brassica napus TaxID=3708 RepID=A0ABQ7YX54_BRANA|nr:hypothetical protein HID58_069875 [Brassica napus]
MGCCFVACFWAFNQCFSQAQFSLGFSYHLLNVDNKKSAADCFDAANELFVTSSAFINTYLTSSFNMIYPTHNYEQHNLNERKGGKEERLRFAVSEVLSTLMRGYVSAYRLIKFRRRFSEASVYKLKMNLKIKQTWRMKTENSQKPYSESTQFLEREEADKANHFPANSQPTKELRHNSLAIEHHMSSRTSHENWASEILVVNQSSIGEQRVVSSF